jgi:hypothetical protein
MNAAAGLRSSQAWTLEHIIRCRCGLWIVVTQAQLEHLDDQVCRHLQPRRSQWEAAA